MKLCRNFKKKYRKNNNNNKDMYYVCKIKLSTADCFTFIPSWSALKCFQTVDSEFYKVFF